MNTTLPPFTPPPSAPVPPVEAELLDRYAAGRCTAEEAEEVRALLASSPLHAELLLSMRRVSAGGARVSQQANVDAGWERFQDKLFSHPPLLPPLPSTQPQSPQTPVSPRRSSWWRKSARIALAAGLSAALILIGFVAASHRQPATSDQALATYVTPPGERARIELTDGTVISLNVASRVEIPRNFGAGTRTVRLWGEAHFNVVHSSGTPFTVDAGALRATVLGTEFGVRAYRQDNMQVAVRTGKVSVNNAVLGANDIVRADAHGELTVLRAQDVASVLGFASGRLVLSDIPLREAVDELNRWYDADIRFGDRALEEQHIRAVLAPGSAGDLTDILELMFDVRIVRNGRILTLYSK